MSYLRLLVRLRAFAPVQLPAARRDLWAGGLGMGLGLLFTYGLTRLALGGGDWLLAPMGATAVLLFFVPASPLVQPWAVIGGNLVGAAVGVVLGRALGHTPEVAALAAALAGAAMYRLRCLHPPGGAMALSAVMAPVAVQQLGWQFVLGPVAANAVFMVLLAVGLNRLMGRRYPHHGTAPNTHRTRDPLPTHRAGLDKEDVDAALASFGEPLDIDREDLEDILHRAELHARQRRLQPLQCASIMSRDVVTAGPGERLDAVWERLVQHRLGALPVVDRKDRLVGIVSLHDFFVGPQGPVVRGYNPARRVQEIMTRRVRTARPEQPLAELVPQFSDEGLHHMPVIDNQRRVVGMVTQSDLVAALFKARTGV